MKRPLPHPCPPAPYTGPSLAPIYAIALLVFCVFVWNLPTTPVQAERRSREIRTEPPAENIREGLGPNDIQTINDHRRATLQAPLMIPATEQEWGGGPVKSRKVDPLRSSFDDWWDADGHRIGGDRIKMSQAFAAGVRAEVGASEVK